MNFETETLKVIGLTIFEGTERNETEEGKGGERGKEERKWEKGVFKIESFHQGRRQLSAGFLCDVYREILAKYLR